MIVAEREVRQMSLNAVSSSERVHIGFFGCRNAGKSSVVNAVTGQSLCVVSDVAGTTTDPVKKAMELLPLGPVVMVDTPGFDDSGDLGELRIQKTREVLRSSDLAVLVANAQTGLNETDKKLLSLFAEQNIPFILAYNKADLITPPEPGDNELYISAKTGWHIHELKEKVAQLANGRENRRKLIADLLCPGDTVVLVTPIDSAAPKGRLILPQQQTIRDVLEAGATAVVTRETELAQTLKALAVPPRMVVTDSQAFEAVAAVTPPEVPLTSFSILFARYKGNLRQAVEGAAYLDCLQSGDTVLICEGCTHHRQCDDIGTVKLPKWINAYTGKDLRYAFTSGGEFPENLSSFALIIHCGGCMLNGREMSARANFAAQAGIPMTNYGVAIAQMHGILKRSLQPFAKNAE